MRFSENRFVDFVTGCVFTAGVLAAFSSLIPFFARLHWMADLFSHFRVQFALALLIAALVMLCCRRRGISLVFLGFMIPNLVMVLPLYFPPPVSGEGEPLGQLKVLLFNVNSGRGDPDRVLSYLQATDAEVIVIQEFSSRWLNLLEGLRSAYPHQIHEVREDNFGMALLSARPLASREVFYFTEIALPSIGVEMMLAGQKTFLLATHPLPPVNAENTELRDGQLNEIGAFLKDLPGPVLLLGDLNSTPWSPSFRDLIRQTGLRDSMRGFGIQPTWPAGLPPLWIPLDHLLHSPHFTVTGRRTGPASGSDHYPLEVSLDFR